ncbi:MAG: ring-opening amidohydrolase [Granulosicoccus sp.]
MTRRADVHRIAMQSPDDVSGIRLLIEQARLDPCTVVAVLGKTEGNGCVNDFTRGYATQSLRHLFSHWLSEDQLDKVPFVMSGGTEGGLSPHWIVITVKKNEEPPQNSATVAQALAVGSAVTRDLLPSELGRCVQADIVKQGVLKAMHQANIQSPDDVHLVQVKCPLLTSGRIEQVGGDVATTDTLKSMSLSRAASALGVGMALGEVARVDDVRIGTDLSLWSGRASCSAGIELMGCEIVVLGQSISWSGPLRVAHAVMQDTIDASTLMDLIARTSGERYASAHGSHIVATLAKAEASSTGHIRGSRHTMLNDSDIAATRHVRSFVGGLLAGLVGNTEIFVSGGAEHQGPDGGGPVAIIYSTDSL